MRVLRIAMAQMNSTVGDLTGNTAKVLQYIERARELGADIVSFPEMAVPGYPAEDLLLKPQFIADNLEALQEIARGTHGITAVVGFIDKKEDIYNAAAILHNGQVVDVYHKMFLPNYGVFDENRYFQAGTAFPVYTIHGVRVGVNICEDIWYPTGPTSVQARAGAEVIININASPYHRGKRKFREKMLATRATDCGVIICYTNLVGGQDELVFDGNSLLLDERGELVAMGRQFEEDLVVHDVNPDSAFRSRLHDPRRRKERFLTTEEAEHVRRITISEEAPSAPKPFLPPREVRPLEDAAEVYHALVLGVRDYVQKSGFGKVLIALSGGIDSSITAVIAADALGGDNVIGVAMPSRFSSPGSLSDASALAENLGLFMYTIPIEPAFQAYLDMLAGPFQGTQFGVAEENLQARIRGNILMALSNKFGWLVLTTGNKSEMATGYSTLYGDMAGGFAVIKDVPKTLVYEIARYRNSLEPKGVIPETVMVKEPSAELRPDQKDVDTLPPYSTLDPILEAYVEQDKSFEEIAATGFDEATVRRVIRMVDRNEYKRRQAPPGIKITPRAFGKDRRLPIVNKYTNFNHAREALPTLERLITKT